MNAGKADRRVHVTIVPHDGGRIEIVRYDRAGKWWYEPVGGKRRQLTFAEAVEFARPRASVIWHSGLPGGARFDAAVRALTRHHDRRGMTDG